MPLPLLRRCCGCLSLKTGCYLMCVVSILACIADIIAGAWYLPQHREREPEDNLISMSMVMFATLSAIGNIVVLLGIARNRPGYLELSVVFNSVFIVCLFLVAIVTCIFRLDDFFKLPGNIALVVILFLVAASYCFYYVTAINSLYRTMKFSYSGSAIPV